MSNVDISVTVSGERLCRDKQKRRWTRSYGNVAEGSAMVIVGFGSQVPRLIDELKVLVLNWEANAGHWEPSNRCYWQVNNYWLLCFACYGACQGCNSESEGENEELSHEHPGLNTYRPTRPLNARPAKCWARSPKRRATCSAAGPRIGGKRPLQRDLRVQAARVFLAFASACRASQRPPFPSPF